MRTTGRLYVPITLLIALVVALLALAACQNAPEQVEVTRLVEVQAEPQTVEVTRVVEVVQEVAAEPSTGGEPVVMSEGPDVPFLAQWQASPHNDVAGEAFVHWNADDPAEVPTSCAKCHSTYGYIDFLGADGSPHGTVDAPAALGSTVECIACHNSVAPNMTSVTFPSGLEVHNLGAEARCMECHQGRASTQTVNAKLEELGLGPEDEDIVSADVGFTNIHYYATAATQYGTMAMGGYEYDGKSYDAKYNHVVSHDTCTECHNPHTLEIELETCATCHANVNDVADLDDIRMQGSLVDYDGDGDMTEGIRYEIEDMTTLLYTSIQTYAANVSGVPIVYDSHSHPYFFIDANANGTPDEGESTRENAYNGWTPRLAKAAYNYQVALKDPGAYAHGGKYIIALVYDSIEDLNSALETPLDTSALRRIDHGHFAGSEEAFRHWDAEGAVPADCATCHSGNGLPFELQNGVQIAHAPTDGLDCATCHSDATTYATYKVETVSFPSGATLALDDLDSNLCLMCHQGRESSVSVNRVIGDTADDEVSEALRFVNPHYFASGATLFGSEAQGAYQYEGQEYLGRNEHVRRFDTCTECHNTHSLEVEVQQCAICHDNVDIQTRADLDDIRFSRTDVYVDYDGDGNSDEGIHYEITSMVDTLFAAIQAYAIDTVGNPIAYDSHAYPYFFVDSNGNGVADPAEANYGNRYVTWTPRMLRAAYNFQWAAKDPGGYAHNGRYLLQVLYDSLSDIGAPMSGMARP